MVNLTYFFSYEARPVAALYYCNFAQFFQRLRRGIYFKAHFFRDYSAAVYTIVISALFLFVPRPVMAVNYCIFGSNFFSRLRRAKFLILFGPLFTQNFRI